MVLRFGLYVGMVKKIKYLTMLTLCVALASFTIVQNSAAHAIKIVVIDPGHGGKDPGCSGVTHKEKDIALAVALKLGKYLEENFKDLKVIYTRTTDVFVDLEERALIANRAKADLFISIHCNAAGKPVMVTDPKTGKQRPKMYKNKKGRLVAVETANPLPYGTETYVMGIKNEEGKMKVAQRENSAIFYEEDYEKKYGGFDPESEESYIIMSNYTSAYVIQSANLAVKFQEEYARKAGRFDKGVHRQSIWVLWRTSMPSILTEIGYLTNPLEEEFLASAKGQEYLAKAMFRGFRRYKDDVEGKKREYDDEFENQEPLENENLKAGNLLYSKKAPVEPDSVPEEKEEEEQKAPVVKETKEEKPDATAVKTQTFVILEDKKTAPPKEIVSENKFTYIGDKVDTVQKATDTTVSASAIAEKFRKERLEAEVQNKILNADEKVVVKISAETILFKVQFASSDMMLDLKQPKFAAVKDADFYRVGTMLKYTSGQFMALKDAAAHQNSLREKGFKDCFVVAFKNGQRIDMAEARRLTESK